MNEEFKRIHDVISDFLSKNHMGFMSWTEDFWNMMLSFKQEERKYIFLKCDNDITEIYVGTEFPEYGTEEYKEIISVNSEIQTGIELLNALGFNASYV